MTPPDEALRTALARASAASSAPRLDGQTFLGLRDLIADASGIAFDERSRFIVERRLLSRLRALRLGDFESYYRLLLYSPEAADEMSRMLEAVAIRETYFYRELQQLETFRDVMLPRLKDENGPSRSLRIWSAGCATGEEPYTLSIFVRESGLFAGWDVTILGTDLIPSAIAIARRGVFRDSSMRAIPDSKREQYFTREGANAWRLDESIRTSVFFDVANVVDSAGCAKLPMFDVVFCRNVMIYLGAEARRQAASNFWDHMRTGASLWLGHAESLLSLRTPFQLTHVRRDVVYMK